MINTRFAPSPTGLLHLGHVYSAMFASNIAKANGGKFYLRIEDIDKQRCLPKFEHSIYDDLHWLGITWDPSVIKQSNRLSIYKKEIQKLESLQLLYPCFCSRKEILNEINQVQSAPHLRSMDIAKSRYPGTCRKLSHSQIQKKIFNHEPYSLRLNMAKAINLCGPIDWIEVGVGRQIAQPQIFGDIIIARKDIPTSYHLSVTVDDHLQGINRVTRGNDLFEATHVHRILQELLEYSIPEYQHHHLMVDDKGNRFAKRTGSMTLKSLREEGKTPDQVLDLVNSLKGS